MAPPKKKKKDLHKEGISVYLKDENMADLKIISEIKNMKMSPYFESLLKEDLKRYKEDIRKYKEDLKNK